MTEPRVAPASAAIARRVFTGAGIYGLIVMTPLLFMERRIGDMMPPAITHPENFYGFVTVTIAWQVAFLIIGRDPVRFRPLMPAAMLEKIGFVVASAWLYGSGRVPGMAVAGAVGDAILLVLFIWAYHSTPKMYSRA